MTEPNQAASGNGATTSLFHAIRSPRTVPEPRWLGRNLGSFMVLNSIVDTRLRSQLATSSARRASSRSSDRILAHRKSMKTTAVACCALLALTFAGLAEELAGIGLKIIQRRNESEPLRTSTVYPGSPAERAGVKSNGFLISVDGTNVVSMSMTQAVGMVRGRLGTPVTVQIADSAMGHTNSFTMNRSRMVFSDNKIEFLDH